WCAAGVAAGTLALLVAGAVATARRRVEDTVAFTSRRATGAIGWTFAAVALIAAAVAIWQLRRYGEASGASGADLLATPGPALALLACAALALLAVPFPLALAERALAGRRRLGLLLPAWQVTRRLPVYASVVVLVVVTAGAGVLAASYSATWTGLQEDLADVRSGADVRVTFDRAGPLTPARPAESAEPYLGVEGASDAVGVLSTGARIGDESAALLAMPAGGLLGVVEARDDVFPAGRAASDVTPEQPRLTGLELPAGTERLEVDATGASAVTLLVADADGVLAQAVVEDGAATVPAGFGTVVAADLTVTVPGASEPAVTALRAVDGSGAATDLPLAGVAPWTPQVPASYRIESAAPGTASPLSATVFAAASGATVRVTPPDGGDPIPVVASQAALDHFGLQTGDPVSLHVVGARVDARVVDAVPVVPGVADPVAFVADLPSLTATLLRVADRPQRITEVWLSADGGGTAELAAAVEEAGLAGEAQVTDRETVRSGLLDHGLARHVVPAFWSVAAAAIVLTAIGAVASAATLQRQRRGELAVLRVVGVTPSEQARSRRIEQAGMGLLAMVAGAAGGLVVAALTVTVLARAATSGVPRALEPVCGASLGALAVFGVVLAGVVAAVALLHASRAGHDAALAVPGEERR
ncbi:FtsX-like permease family protein, partial [Jiangella rhizosphaerae]|uniref:FtsX-like permease family protein n=1 Tax=Jiangella rhizosphaerae TaxID=2293569 RepID=UPI0018F552B1